MAKNKPKRIVVEVTIDQHKKIKETSLKLGMTISAFIKQAIDLMDDALKDELQDN